MPWKRRTRSQCLCSPVRCGAVLGGGAIQRLHAQTKPPAYDPGYKAIARGGKTAAIEGDPPSRDVFNIFSDMNTLLRHIISRTTRLRVVGDKYSKFHIYAVEGVAP
jgi:hypothetical protein